MTPLFPKWDSAPVFLQCPHQACLQAVLPSFLAQWSWISAKLSCPGSQLINDQSSEISLLYWRKEEWVPLIIRAARSHYRRVMHALELPRWPSGEESACQYKICRNFGFDPWVRKIPWRRTWQPTPVFLPGKSYGQKNLSGYGPWGHKESDNSWELNMYTMPAMKRKHQLGGHRVLQGS